MRAVLIPFYQDKYIEKDAECGRMEVTDDLQEVHHGITYRRHTKRQYNDVFDYVFQSGSHTVLIKLQESLDWHCTKQEFDTLMDSVTNYCNAFYEAEICVVSFSRFSNYCVKQAGQLDNLHLVVG